MAAVHYEVGDIVEVKMGAGVRKIYVTAKHSEVKNGEPSLSGILVNDNDEPGDDVWAYDHQVVAVTAVYSKHRPN